MGRFKHNDRVKRAISLNDPIEICKNTHEDVFREICEDVPMDVCETTRR